MRLDKRFNSLGERLFYQKKQRRLGHHRPRLSALFAVAFSALSVHLRMRE
jgi:hypothetical protein